MDHELAGATAAHFIGYVYGALGSANAAKYIVDAVEKEANKLQKTLARKQPLLEVFYIVQRKVPARQSLSGKEYWERLLDDNDSLHKQTSIELAREDLTLARRTHGPANVRLIKATHEIVR